MRARCNWSDRADAIAASSPDFLEGAPISGPAGLKLRWDCFGQDVEADHFVFQVWESSVQVLERADWLGFDVAVLLAKLGEGVLEPREKRLLFALGEATFAAVGLQQFPTGRTVVVGQVLRLRRNLLDRALEALPVEALKGFAAAVGVLNDYERLGHTQIAPAPYSGSPLGDLEELIRIAIDRLVAAGEVLPDDAVLRLRNMEPKVVGMRSVGRLQSVEAIIAEQTLFPWGEDESQATYS